MNVVERNQAVNVLNRNETYPTRAERLKTATDRLEAGIADLFNSDNYAAYLTAMSKFHRYSYGNVVLILSQCPEASQVAGLRTWNKFGRSVKRGERGIQILMPCSYTKREKQDATVEEQVLDESGQPVRGAVAISHLSFKVGYVFDVSQTDGEPIPELEAKELLSTVEGYEDFVKAVTYVAPVPISFEDIPGDSKGFFSPTEKRIAVQEGMSESQTLKTMVHETAHSMLHDKEINKDILAPAKDRNTKEVEALYSAFQNVNHFKEC